VVDADHDARELAAVYTAFPMGETFAAVRTSIGYGDYSEWQHQWLGTEQVRDQVNLLEDQLRMLHPSWNCLRMDRARPNKRFEAQARRPLSEEIITGIKNWRSLANDAFHIAARRLQDSPIPL